MNIVLISTYDLGRQPFGLASPAAWLRSRGHTVHLVDLSLSPLPSLSIREADLVGFYLPMHTATRLAVPVIERIRLLNPGIRLCAFGLYAPLSESYLRELGVNTILGGEFEAALADVVGSPREDDRTIMSLDRLTFLPADRTGLPALSRYARMHINGICRTVGYTEASRGCKHLCRHCPVVPVYRGTFRVVQPDVVLYDIRNQVEAGAEHITFGDPDFFNGPQHAMRIVRELHAEFPEVTYDVTIKIEHLLKERARLDELAATGCAFVTSAVESVDDEILIKLDKGHTRRDFLEAVEFCRAAGLSLAPTFIPFTPWTTHAGYLDLLRLLAAEDLVDYVSPVQLALRLLVPKASRLLELPEIGAFMEQYDKAALLYRWEHPDPEMDTLASAILRVVNEEQRQKKSRREIFARVWQEASNDPLPENFDLMPRATIPYMDEPWYC